MTPPKIGLILEGRTEIARTRTRLNLYILQVELADVWLCSRAEQILPLEDHRLKVNLGIRCPWQCGSVLSCTSPEVGSFPGDFQPPPCSRIALMKTIRAVQPVKAFPSLQTPIV